MEEEDPLDFDTYSSVVNQTNKKLSPPKTWAVEICHG